MSYEMFKDFVKHHGLHDKTRTNLLCKDLSCARCILFKKRKRNENDICRVLSGHFDQSMPNYITKLEQEHPEYLL